MSQSQKIKNRVISEISSYRRIISMPFFNHRQCPQPTSPSPPTFWLELRLCNECKSCSAIEP